MEQLKDLIARLIEKRSRFQVILIVLLCLNSITVGIHHTITSFHTYTPRFFCADYYNGVRRYGGSRDRFNVHTDQCIVNVNGTICPSGYIFDIEDDITTVVEWSLVCDRRLLGPLINTLYFVGVTIGALICSSLADLWGRKRLVLICLYSQAVMSIGLYFTQHLEVFMLFRVIQGFFIQGLQTCSYTLMLEYCPARYRTAAAVFWETNWAIGLGILGITAYFVRTWRLLTLVLILPSVLSLAYIWIIPESVTWLYAKGRYREALMLVRKIAIRDKDSITKESVDQIELESRAEGKIIENGENCVEDSQRSVGVLQVWRCRVLRKHLLIMIAIWFSVTLSYYGILYFLPNLAGQRHLNFLVGAAIEAIAYIFAYFILSRFGRRIPLAVYQYTNGILCIAMGLIAIAPSSPVQSWSLIVISLVAKGLAVSNFCGMFIYCSELFPTICRGIALGLCGFAARCGSLLAPQLMTLMYYTPPYVPMSIMALLIICTGTATILLPETLSTHLPNTMKEAMELWEK